METTEQELIKMSSKGQLVVPQDIREMEHFIPGERFVAFPVEDGVLFKKVIIPRVEAQFEKVSKEIGEQFRKQNIKEEDVVEAVKWAKRK